MRMERALGEFSIGGICTTIPFHKAVLQHPAFRSGQIDTDFVIKHEISELLIKEFEQQEQIQEAQMIPAETSQAQERGNLSANLKEGSISRTFRLKVNDRFYEVDVVGD